MILSQILIEKQQELPTRQKLYRDIEKILDRTVVAYFTSFKRPVLIDDDDAGVLENVLQQTDLSKGLALLISSPGGYAVAAERIINVCRSYSSTKDYWAIIPCMAKSAATLICFGASKLIMSSTSELGCVDPQVFLEEKRYSVHNLLSSYEDLFARAIQEKGRLEPYLQQLERYDERLIPEFRSAVALSEDIAVNSLQTGMMKGLTRETIGENIAEFVTPVSTMSHDRPVFAGKAEDSKLKIDMQDPKGKLWLKIHELYFRLNHLVSTTAVKIVETKDQSFVAPAK